MNPGNKLNMKQKRIYTIYKNGLLFLATCVVLIIFLKGVNYNPPEIDHAQVIRSLDKNTLQKGRDIYNKACIACHGADGTASLPQARSFNKDKLRFGNKPYDMWRTITNGAGMMSAQTWLAPAERYYVIQYIREQFMKKSNPRQYFAITPEYLAKLPKSQKTIEAQLRETKKEALAGSLAQGQQWFMYNQSNYGNIIYSQLLDHATSALTMKLDNNILLTYDLLRMGTVAVWKGKLNVSDTKFNRYRGEGEPFIEGTPLEGLDTWQWTYNNQIEKLRETTGARQPLDKSYLDYHGHYAYDKKGILSYSILGRKILELPEAIKYNNQVILSQTLYIEPGEALNIYVGQLKDKGSFKEGWRPGNAGILVSALQKNNTTSKFIAATVRAPEGHTLKMDDAHRMVLSIPASASPVTMKVLRISGKSQAEISTFDTFLKQESIKKNIPDLLSMTKGGPANWSKKVVVAGQLNTGKPHFDPRYHEDEDKTTPAKAVELPVDYPYTIDNIELPFNNAYNAWIRPTSLGFLSNGNLLIGTYTGDVWMATGIDSTLKHISWQRIATGLYEPMGLKVVKDNIYVTCRNGIMLLKDLNGDGETDFYQNFYSDNDVSGFFHAFNFGLETDSKGNFYYVKPGEYTDNKDPGNVIKVSADGKNWESLATGFRVNNGITVTPDDRVFVSDNQGNWTPGNKINFIEKGAFYGYVPNVVEPGWSPDGRKLKQGELINGIISPDIIKVPDTFHPPALWMPQEFDNSPGGGVWSDKSWGPLGNQFIHTSYGTGWVYYFLPHTVGNITQGAMVALPFQLDAGIQRAAVNPVDKQVYTTGLTGWDDGVALKYGILGRIRYKGGEGHLIKDAEVVKGGVELRFNFFVNKNDAADISNYDIAQWNYKWTSKYGSAHYSIKHPGVEGIDTVAIAEAVLREDRKTIFLRIPEIGPAQTMRIRFAVKGNDGIKIKNVVYLTINKVPE